MLPNMVYIVFEINCLLLYMHIHLCGVSKTMLK